ncbi:MAG: hypothetical protein LBN39_12410 [Planctomycetaceae bacterium]|jgi:hypothetical protein|nr:hypothetical protein [Planctomycetaceae bacterium]
MVFWEDEMKTLRIQLTNPKAKKLLRDMASLDLITILPKRKTVIAEPKTEKGKTPYEEICELFARMDEHHQQYPVPEMSMDEIVADIKEFRKERQERGITLYNYQ